MSVNNDVQAKQSENVEFAELSQHERMVLQMFRQMNQQQQRDILRFFDVLLSAK
ncbi:hypothetical protein [Pseudomonas sp. ICMP 19500]|uniref:hypothetical protein n=1 Tax=Pseudomonas sp. ICMP 19500 TaxID=1208102 RepID=UPI000B08BEC1|nr:hypothetical protein [Pseudomonas sp. ICMP 19500]